MEYENMVSGVFISRPNRFIALCEIDGKTETCHVKNTGRCKELLIKGASVYLQRAKNMSRKTAFDLIAVQKGERLINMDSQASNKVFYEWAVKVGIPGLTMIKPEQAYLHSRFDFYIEAGERKIFVEIKGVTLEEEGIALFPDAPTERGIKHLRELSRCVLDGYEAMAVFVIQMHGVRGFAPNPAQPAFKEALLSARASGVQLTAMDCIVKNNGMVLNERVKMNF